MLRKLFYLISLVLVAVGGQVGQARALAQVSVSDHRETIVFGQSIQFWARFESDTPIARIEILYRPQGGLRTLQGQVELDQNEATYIHRIGSHPGAIPVFSSVEYRYIIALENGETVETELFTVEYTDNRYNWQSLSDPPFHAHWVDGDTAFGQAVLDAARAGLKNAKVLIAAPNLEHLDIYVYPRASELQQALELNGFVLAAGHANPELGVIMVSLPAGTTQNYEIQRQVPHELMHILLYEKLGERYANIPIWFDEGLSSLNEVNANPDYYVLLQDALSNDAVLPMTSLCSGFRLEASMFYLSYAQSESFSRFLYDNYGTSGLETLLEKYADGVDCARGLELAYGQSINRLEERWLRSLVGEVNLVQVLGPLLPWLIVLLSLFAAPTILVVRGILRPKSPPPHQETV